MLVPEGYVEINPEDIKEWHAYALCNMIKIDMEVPSGWI
jgi:hypothetical protein